MVDDRIRDFYLRYQGKDPDHTEVRDYLPMTMEIQRIQSLSPYLIVSREWKDQHCSSNIREW